MEKKSWFKRHKALTIILIILVFFIFIVGVFSDGSEEAEKNNCLDLCEEVYNIQAQIDICHGNCYGVGDSMDKYMNTLNKIKNRGN